MNDIIKVKGLVIRTVDMKESDRLVTIFTEERGVITAIAKGARSFKSRQMSSTVQFCYGSYVLYQKGEYFWIKEAELIESFFDIRKSIEGLALAAYICEVLSEVTVAEAEAELLRLSLNSLYAIAKGGYDLNTVKAAFEIRTAAIIGLMPDILACRECGERSGDFYFDIMGGTILCRNCQSSLTSALTEIEDSHERRIISILTEGAKTALAYCIYCPIERIFSFRVTGEDQSFFCRAAEEYLINQLERSFKTLDFYNEVKR